MTTIYLIRHAESEGNLYRRMQGWHNALITQRGRRQVEALGRRFQDIHVDAVYSSDLYRTITTAKAIAVPKGLEIHTDPDLREVNMGDWEDRPAGEVRRLEPESNWHFHVCDPNWRAPNGESLPETGTRVGKAITRIAQAHPDQSVVILCHGTAIRMALCYLRGQDFSKAQDIAHSRNTAVTCLSWDGERFETLMEMDASHLDETMVNPYFKDKRHEEFNLWYRPIDWPAEKPLYEAARGNAWSCVHTNGPAFQLEDFMQAAEADLARTPWGITVAMSGDNIVGLLQLDTQRYSEDKAGYIPFCYIVPERRGENLGVQLIGQAVSFFRPLGRDKLRLRCAPDNDRAQRFYAKYGFVKIGEEQGSRVPLDILELYIGYDR